jgi:hypothetical protein
MKVLNYDKKKLAKLQYIYIYIYIKEVDYSFKLLNDLFIILQS